MLENEIRKVSDALAELIAATLKHAVEPKKIHTIEITGLDQYGKETTETVSYPSEDGAEAPVTETITPEKHGHDDLLLFARALGAEIAGKDGLDPVNGYAKAKEILDTYKVEKIGQVPEADLPAFVKKLEELKKELTK